SHRDGDAQIYVMKADGSGQTRLTNTSGDNTDPSWSPAYSPSRAPANVDFTIPPPPTVKANAVISPAIQVTVTDASWHPVPRGGASQEAPGTTVPGATQVVTMALAANPPGATLSGTTAVGAVDGVATFNNLSIDRPGTYTLSAAAAGLTGATSSPVAVHLTFS